MYTPLLTLSKIRQIPNTSLHLSQAFNSQTSVALRNPDLGDSLQPCAFARAEELESSTHDQNHTAQPSHQRRSESSSYCTFDGRLSSSETSGS